jgi:hypothetical protein
MRNGYICGRETNNREFDADSISLVHLAMGDFYGRNNWTCFFFLPVFCKTEFKRNSNRILLWHYSIVEVTCKCNLPFHEPKN